MPRHLIIVAERRTLSAAERRLSDARPLVQPAL